MYQMIHSSMNNLRRECFHLDSKLEMSTCEFLMVGKISTCNFENWIEWIHWSFKAYLLCCGSHSHVSQPWSAESNVIGVFNRPDLRQNLPPFLTECYVCGTHCHVTKLWTRIKSQKWNRIKSFVKFHEGNGVVKNPCGVWSVNHPFIVNPSVFVNYCVRFS